ncbi:hypothetical protein K431DRAFT_154254 [Polychaeton citri CBS 116435]|uniref:C2H2-type domain-containing protein n=1 Tax=Polychaeton citri CBS 116435 TaxID=1314669 RepID=A0A9P4QEJ7_9PEZI|nr:hypothetical protein K431DRAFT_154254 [Polychaeton citri CBS 116435]
MSSVALPISDVWQIDEPSASDLGVQDEQGTPRCWEHGCCGREFSTRSNLVRHQKERSKAHTEHHCSMCGAVFSRVTALRQHIANQSCARIRRYSNGRERSMPKPRFSRGGGQSRRGSNLV